MYCIGFLDMFLSGLKYFRELYEYYCVELLKFKSEILSGFMVVVAQVFESVAFFFVVFVDLVVGLYVMFFMGIIIVLIGG